MNLVFPLDEVFQRDRHFIIIQWPNSSRRVSEVGLGDFNAKFIIKSVHRPFKSYIPTKSLPEYADS
jgi:hypothetical protein